MEQLLRVLLSVVASPIGADSPARCNPYEQAGVLLVNETSLADNRWEPIDAPANCQPVDYMRILRENKAAPELQFARNRTIVLLGDSVDREFVSSLHLLSRC